MTNQAFRELTSILNPTIDSHEGDSPLLIAMGAVAKALGITILPPKHNRRGVNSPEVIARASGFRVRPITLPDAWWQDDRGAMLGSIATQAEERPVALLPKNGDRGYEIFDPVSFKRIPVGGPTAKYLSPNAYAFYRPFPDKQLEAKDILQFAFRGRSRDIVHMVLFGILASLFGMSIPQATALLIDYVIPDGKGELLMQIGIGLLAASFAMATLEMTRGIVTLRLQTAISADTEVAVWDRLLKLPPSFFRKYASGDIFKRMLAISEISSRLNGSIITTLLTSFFSLLNLGLLFYYSWSLAMLALAVAVITSFFSVIAGTIARPKFQGLQELSGEITGLIVQTLDGISKLRVAAATERFFARWAKKYGQQVQFLLSTQRVEDFLAFFNTVMPGAASMLLFSLVVVATQYRTKIFHRFFWG